MTTLFLEYGADLVPTNKGSLFLVTQWDEIRQRIVRRIFSNPSVLLEDGTPLEADYIFDSQYGIGGGALVGQNMSPQTLNYIKQAVSQGCLEDAAVDQASIPKIDIQLTNPFTYIITVSVQLNNGTNNTFALTISP